MPHNVEELASEFLEVLEKTSQKTKHTVHHFGRRLHDREESGRETGRTVGARVGAGVGSLAAGVTGAATGVRLGETMERNLKSMHTRKRERIGKLPHAFHSGRHRDLVEKLLNKKIRKVTIPASLLATLGAAVPAMYVGAKGGGFVGGSIGKTIGTVRGPSSSNTKETHMKKHASADLELLAQEFLEKTAAGKGLGGRVMGGLRRFGELLKGGKKMTFATGSKKRAINKMYNAKRPGNTLGGYKPGEHGNAQARKEALLSLAARAGTVGAVSTAGYGVKKKLEKK